MSNQEILSQPWPLCENLGSEEVGLELTGAPELDVARAATIHLDRHNNMSIFRRAGKALIYGLGQFRLENGGSLGSTAEITHEQLNNLIGLEPIEMTREASITLFSVISNTDDIAERNEDDTINFEVISPLDTLYVVRGRRKKKNFSPKYMIGVFHDFDYDDESSVDEPIDMAEASEKYILKFNRELGLHVMDRQTKALQTSNTILNLAIGIWDGISQERQILKDIEQEASSNHQDED